MPTYHQTTFRIRNNDSVGLNVDSDWAGSENQNVTIGRGVIYRIRIKVGETDGTGTTSSMHVQERLNGGTWTDMTDLAVGTGAETPIQMMPSTQFTDNDATSQLLTNSGSTFVPGVGDSDNVFSTSISSQETEFEFCLQINSTYDANTHAEVVPDDTLELRIVGDPSGSASPFTGTYNIPVITVTDTDKYVGGAYVETPNRLGPFIDGSGSLYFVCEYAETFNRMTVRKSTDNGLTWRVIDGPNRPAENDMEGADALQSGSQIFMMVVTTTVTFHSFRMSDDASPDTWNIKDQEIEGAYTPHTSQNGSLEVRSDGTFVAFYVDAAAPDRIRYRIRSTGGTWGAQNTVDSEASTNFTCVKTVKGASDTIHIFYKDDTNGIIYYRTLSSADALSGRTSIATGIAFSGTPDNVPILPQPSYWNDGDEKILLVYQKAEQGALFSKLLTNGTPGTEEQASDNTVDTDAGGSGPGGSGGSDTPDASLCLDTSDNVSYLIYSRVSDGNIYRAVYTPSAGSGSWGTDSLQLTTIDAQFISAKVVTHSGGKVVGFFYDDRSAGGTGQIWYDEEVLQAAAGGGNPPVGFGLRGGSIRTRGGRFVIVP